MNRCVALMFALLLAGLTVSSACIAEPSDWIHFTLEPERGGHGKVQVSFRDETRGTDRNNWSSGFMPSELIGLDIAGFRSSGTRPLRFALVREAGRLDCNGNGGSGYAAGHCSFAPDPRFTQLLISRGIRRPTRDEAFGLMALNVRRDLIDAVASARYPTPTIGQLMAMTAVGVNGRYVSDMARAGYRPQSIQSLVEFKALGITSDWIAGFARVGYAALPPNQLAQLKAMDVSPEFVAGFDRIGYAHLPVETLVQLKALDITPEFVRSTVGPRSALPPVSQLVEMKMFGRRR
jgi:hypothetical protein